METEKEWTAKDDLEALLGTFEQREGPKLPKVDVNKLQKVQATVKATTNKRRKSLILDRPLFLDKHVTSTEWNIIQDHYEKELEYIIVLYEGSLEKIVNLEEWFLSFYPPSPKVHDEEALNMWKESQKQIANRYYSDLLPKEYRTEVSKALQQKLSTKWKDDYIHSVMSRKVVVFREIKVVKLPPKVNRTLVTLRK